MSRRNAWLSGWVVLCFTACHSSGIDGKLRVRTGLPSDSSDRQDTVILGDGSQFRASIDDAGTALFSDPDLTGPVDVSWVRVRGDGSVAVTTVLGVDQPEIVLVKSAPPVSLTFRGRVTGKVLGVPDGGTAWVGAFGAGAGGSTTNAQSDGSYALDVVGDRTGPIDLVALLGAYGAPTEIGLRRDVPPLDGGVLAGQDLSLERPVTSLPVSIDNAEQYPQLPDAPPNPPPGESSPPRATVTYSLDGAPVFTTHGDATTPVATFDRSPPYDAFTAEVFAIAGDLRALPNGLATASEPLSPEATAVHATLPDPLHIVAPGLGTADAPAEVAALDEVKWTAEPTAQLVRLQLSGGSQPLSWLVYAPADATGFRPFPLPASVSPIAGFGSGLIGLRAVSRFNAENGSYAERFSPDAGVPGGSSHGTQLEGWLRIP